MDSNVGEASFNPQEAREKFSSIINENPAMSARTITQSPDQYFTSSQTFDLLHQNGYSLKDISDVFSREDQLQIKQITKQIKKIIKQGDSICKIPIIILSLLVLSISFALLVAGVVLVCFNKPAKHLDSRVGVCLLFVGIIFLVILHFLTNERKIPIRKEAAQSIETLLKNEKLEMGTHLDLMKNSYNLRLSYNNRVATSIQTA